MPKSGIYQILNNTNGGLSGIENTNAVLIHYKGEMKCIKDLAGDSGINYNTLYARLVSKKWSVEKALTTPIRGKKK